MERSSPPQHGHTPPQKNSKNAAPKASIAPEAYPSGSGAGLTPNQRNILSIQQTQGNAAVCRMLKEMNAIRRDLAVAPTTSTVEVAELTADQVDRAIIFNRVGFTNPDEIGLLRDVLGISDTSTDKTKIPVIDVEFIRAVARYQSRYGLRQDGMLGQRTAQRLSQELQAESVTLGAAANTHAPGEMAVNPGTRRMALRAQVANRLGTLMYQAFVGSANSPSGIVTIRGNDRFGTAPNVTSDVISIDYTGEGGATAHWLQFVNVSFMCFQPGNPTPIYQSGTIPTLGSPIVLSSPTATIWAVDSNSTTSPVYDAAGASESAPRTTRMFDKPGGAPGTAWASGFAATLSPPANRVVLQMNFEVYLIRNNQSVYRVIWSAKTTYNTGSSPATASPIAYSTSGGNNTNGLPANLQAVLLAKYPGSPIH